MMLCRCCARDVDCAPDPVEGDACPDCIGACRPIDRDAHRQRYYRKAPPWEAETFAWGFSTFKKGDWRPWVWSWEIVKGLEP